MKLKPTVENEADIQKAILKTLAANGVWAWRVNSGATVVGAGGSRRMFRGAPPGTPDIRVEMPSGYLEVKSATGKLTDYQKAWHARAEREGVRVAVVRSAAEALRVVESWTD